jgi:hypothetical protein
MYCLELLIVSILKFIINSSFARFGKCYYYNCNNWTKVDLLIYDHLSKIKIQFYLLEIMTKVKLLMINKSENVWMKYRMRDIISILLSYLSI